MSNQRKYFGTDGIRGKVGTKCINPEFILKLGWAIGCVLGRIGHGPVLIGKDTRISGYMFESALEAGLSAAGVDIHLLGPMPTPAVAYLTRTLRAQAGIVISASHNQYHDNGIKFFAADGRKLPDAVEIAIESQLEKTLIPVDSQFLGKATRVVDAPGRYIEFCKSTLPSQMQLGGLKVVLDCAHGATYHIAPSVLRELGAQVIETAVDPNGLNINNQCGSTAPQALAKAVLANQADVGVAFDGDGDRVVMVDHLGRVVDGDEILYVIAKYMHQTGQLLGGVVGTVVSNKGIELSLKKQGIEFSRSPVGDRYVLEELVKRGWSLGGESSGHIINLQINQTGDGIVAALQVLAAMSQANSSLRDLLKDLERLPQVIHSVASTSPRDVVQSDEIQSAVKSAEKSLGDSGRVLIRPSGTEPLVRIMVEGVSIAHVERTAEQLRLSVMEQSQSADIKEPVQLLQAAVVV